MDERDLDEALRRMSQVKVNRRGFLAVAGLSGTAAALAACTGGSASSSTPTGTPGAVPSTAVASAAPAVSAAPSYELESELLTYNWSEYVSEKNKAEFTARTGVAYSEDIFSNNEELVAKLAAAGGNPGYDIACPTGEYCPGMIEAGYLEKLDMSRIPNFQYINAAFKNTAWDPNNEYIVPKDYGTTGIMYRPKLVSEPVTTWREFYDLAKGKYSGKVVVVDSMGDVFPFPLKMLGYSVNDNDPAHLKEAGDILIDLAPHLLALDSENYDDKLGTEEAALALCWAGGLNDLRANPDTADAVYLNPKEGGLYWMDVWVVLKNPPHPNAAYAWLNFIHEPAIQAEETVANNYATANDAAKELVPAELVNDPAVFPPDDVVGNLEGSLDHSGVQQRQDIWSEFKSKIGS
jgi:spermidine/putrescine transport system substrate-binding protein